MWASYNYILAAVWLLLALVLFQMDAGNEAPRYAMASWLALALGFYNLIKGIYYQRLLRAARRHQQQPTPGRVLPSDGRGPIVQDEHPGDKQPEPGSPFAGFGDDVDRKSP